MFYESRVHVLSNSAMWFSLNHFLFLSKLECAAAAERRWLKNINNGKYILHGTLAVTVTTLAKLAVCFGASHCASV